MRHITYDATLDQSIPNAMKWSLSALSWLLSWLPLRAARGCAGAFGWLMHRLDTRTARVTRTNLALCFTQQSRMEREELARSSLGHTACLAFESAFLAHWTRGRLQKLVVSETGRQALRDGLQTGSVLMLVPHFGNWEFLCFALGETNLVSLYNPPRQQSLEALLRRSRERFGARMVPAARRGCGPPVGSSMRAAWFACCRTRFLKGTAALTPPFSAIQR